MADERPAPRAARLSVTDRCDMACVYCRPSKSERYLGPSERLRVQDWEALGRALAKAGVRRVRLTGGEPLLHPNIVEIVARLSDIGLSDLALTTNGTRLSQLAEPLRRAGLQRINISLDSLIPDRFAAITGGGHLPTVLEGLQAAVSAGFDTIKTNTVVLAGRNDDELPAITSFAWERHLVPRFIELMGVGHGAALVPRHFVSYQEMRARLRGLLPDGDGRPDVDRGPARYVSSIDGHNRVGFIHGSSAPFCDECDRVRVSADGVLRPCLARGDGVPVSGARDMGEAIEVAWRQKPGPHFRGCNDESARSVSMCRIGG